MAEQTETTLLAKITVIDAEIDKIIAVLGTSGEGGVQNLDYSLGNKSVSGSQRLKQLMEVREMYQKMLNAIPKTYTENHDYDIKQGTGKDDTEYVGDET